MKFIKFEFKKKLISEYPYLETLKLGIRSGKLKADFGLKFE